jgi:hypothetical protein
MGILCYLSLTSQHMPDIEKLPSECILNEEINAQSRASVKVYAGLAIHRKGNLVSI